MDAEQELAAQYGVLGMPTFMLFATARPSPRSSARARASALESELEQALVQQPAGR